MKTIAFFVQHFSERGTEIAVYDYAKYNEEILQNKSIILCFNENTQKRLGTQDNRMSFKKFNDRFEIIEINSIFEFPYLIDKYLFDFFYILTHGNFDETFMFENEEIWNGKFTRHLCKTIKHCVFTTKEPQGDYCISISNHLNKLYKTNIPVIPHIVSNQILTNKNLRDYLKIPNEAIVFGRHGGFETFDIYFVYETIKDILLNGPQNVYFLFMNTHIFIQHPRVIYMHPTTDNVLKTAFINTCDAMIHARLQGETFGLSVAEFSVLNKPVITYADSYELEHIEILGERAILYRNSDELKNNMLNIKSLISSRNDWNAYSDYSPEKVMRLFHDTILSK